MSQDQGDSGGRKEGERSNRSWIEPRPVSLTRLLQECMEGVGFAETGAVEVESKGVQSGILAWDGSLGESKGEDGESESDAPLDLTGVTLGSVRLERKLGAGGMGEVWFGHEVDLDIPVAVKILPSRFAGSQDAVMRFMREARAVARLDHPNVVRVLQSGRREHGGAYLRVLVMEYVEGRDAYDALSEATGRRLNPTHAAEIILGAARGLRHAHARGVIHRDIKPSNLLLPNSGGVKVADFGLSRVAGAATLAAHQLGNQRPGDTMLGMVMGTPAYMSPEQGQGLPMDGRTDVYSLGVTFFELLTGRPPFTGLDVYSLIEHHVQEPFDFAPTEFDHLPPLFRRLIEGMCQKVPGDRIELSELVRELESFVGERAERAGSGAVVERIAIPTNLTDRDTSFVGRESDLQAIDRAFAQGARLVTIHGPGGVGKTRLTQEYGLGVVRGAGAVRGGVWFCDLTEARSAAGIAEAVGRGLGLNLTQSDPVAQVHTALRLRGSMILVLDNFEQVVAYGPETVGVWLKDTAQVRFLVSSRAPLHIEGERLIAIEALDSVPPRKKPGSEPGMSGQRPTTRKTLSIMDDVAPAVRLFADRAAMVRRDFKLGADNLAVIERICQELDGIPLAIELAAARISSMTPQQLLDRLPRRFELLTSKRRDGAARQATMFGAIEWSWNLLTPWEQLALAQSSVFVDGFSLESAERVVNLSSFPDAPFTIDVIESLAEKSLVRALEQPSLPGEMRYRMYESIREYAARRMSQPGAVASASSETGDAAAQALALRHAEYHVAHARVWSQRIVGAGGKEAIERIAMELANLFAAQDAMEAVSPRLSAEAALYARDVVKTRGPWHSRVERLTRAIGCVGDDRELEAQLTVALAQAHFDAGSKEPLEVTARRAEELAAALVRSDATHPRLRVMADATGMLGQSHARFGRFDEALDCYARAIRWYRECGDEAGRALCLGRTGQVLGFRGLFREATTCFAEAERSYRRVGHWLGISAAVGNLAMLAIELGERDRALRGFKEAEAIDREQGNLLGVASWIGGRGSLAMTNEDYGQALECFVEAEELCRTLGARAILTTWIGIAALL